MRTRESGTRTGIGSYFRFFNEERPQQPLGYRTPTAVYTASRTSRRKAA